MFYCQQCAAERKWPYFYGLPMSRGPCELCGKVRSCADVPSRALPESRKRPSEQTRDSDNADAG